MKYKKEVIKLNMWAVIWTEKALEEYGVPLKNIIISVEPKEDIKVNISSEKIGRPKYLFTDTLAIFETKKEAEAYRAGNKDWVSIPCKII